MNYTSKEQSKRLIELGLSKDTADMFYPDTNELSEIRTLPRCIEFEDDKAELPCWSVGALLGILPDNCGINKEDEKYVASYLGGSYTSDNPVDACVSMIEYLHELKML